MGGNSRNAQQAYQEQLRQIQLQREQQMREKLQQLKTEYVSTYSLPLNYPAKVNSVSDDDDNSKKDSIRTSQDFINARLLEAGLPLGGGAPSKLTLGDHSVAVQRFINDLEGTGCYDSVQVHIGNNQNDRINNNDDASPEQQQSAHEMFDVTVRLKEKRWYRIHIGGGVNSDDLSSLGTSSGTSAGNFFGGGAGAALGALPKLQFESSISASNLSGFADTSTALYSVDQTGASTFKFTHDRPLCSCLPKHSNFYDWLMPQDPRLVSDKSIEEEGSTNDASDEMQVYLDDDAQYAVGGGSHVTLGVHALCLEQDFESTRSSKEFTRSIGVRLANHCRGASRGPGIGGANRPSTSPPESMAGPYFFLDWSACLRDNLPKRHSEFPFALDCSKEVANQAGTTFKHSVTGGMYLNGSLTDDRYDPTMGYDAHFVGEFATPPGDAGFWKMKGGGAFHIPLELLRLMTVGTEPSNADMGEEETSPSVIGLTLHSSLNFGVIRPLTFNGLCKNVGGIPLSDRFYTGGPGQLRGFLPAGLGPRASAGGSSSPGGDSLGGDMFYTSMLAASIPLPSYFATLRQNGGRLFGFANAGTCVSLDPSVGSFSACSRILNSSRASIGGGVSMATPMGRFELTYAVPFRYGPKDARKNVQMGFAFSFG